MLFCANASQPEVVSLKFLNSEQVMWKREEVVSSSDESLEEEVSHGAPGGFETAAGACKLKPVFDDIFADIQASIPTLDLEDSSEVRK